MRIAVDARELRGQPTGVGRYLAHLLQAWEDLPEAGAHEFVRYAPEGDATAGTRWEQVSLPLALRRDRPDVLFAPAYTAPVLAGVPVVLTIHDLSFAAHPEWFPPRSAFRRRAVATLAARRARIVITDAQFSKGELVRLLGVPAEKVRVIPLGVTGPRAGLKPCPTADSGGALLQSDRGGALLQGYPGTANDGGGAALEGCLGRPTILFVGSIFNRRHLPELIRAFAVVRSRHPEVRLEIVGDNRTYPALDLRAMAAAAGVAEAVSIRSYVPDDVLAALYREAGVFAFLSDYEGFGLTPLEAMQAGVPVLAGDTAVAREVYGDAAAYVNTSDVARIAAQLERLLLAPDARAALLERTPAVLARYSWQRTARETLAALVEAARG